MTIYIGNLSHQASEEQLNALFATYGEVKSAKIIMDHYSGQSKGFAFVEMQEQSASEEAIQQLNGTNFMDRPLSVSEARPRATNNDRQSGGYGQRSNNGGGYNSKY
jgi:RNA recognition motif-containing protein